MHLQHVAKRVANNNYKLGHSNILFILRSRSISFPLYHLISYVICVLDQGILFDSKARTPAYDWLPNPFGNIEPTASSFSKTLYHTDLNVSMSVT